MKLDVGTGLLALTWLIGWFLCFQIPRLPAATRTSASVSVVIPARDEEETLPALLDGLAHQTVAPVGIIVVDDHSSDATARVAAARVAAAGGAHVFAAPPLPDGWTGKAWACATGVADATGDVLVFLDADTVPGPDLLARLLTTLDERGGLVSVMPYHRMERTYERLSACFHVIAWMGIGAASARPGAPVTGAFGPCLACRRADYDAVGGHEAVRAAVVDDIALAKRFRGAELPVFVAAGRHAARYRLYANGIRQLAEGWSKNFAAGAGSTPAIRFLLVVAWVIGCGTAAQVPFRSAMTTLAGWSYPGVVGWVAYAAFAVQLAVMLRPLGNYSWSAALFPIPLAAWFAIFFRSIVWMARGRVRWKGRVVPVRR